MKLTLDSKNLTENFFEHSVLLGIMAPMKDYVFCWQLNNALHVDFRINNDIEIQLTKKTRNYFFSVYQFTEENTSLTHYLYNNRFDGEYLLPEFRHLDFLWLLKGDLISQQMLHQLMDAIRTINGVQLVVELTNEQIKNKEHLIF